MSLTERDRKIVMFVIPIVVIAVYWFILLAPKREAASTASAELTTQQQRLEDAELRVNQLNGDRTDFAADYAEMVRLGKAVPTRVDMPTLLVQLESASRGTDIEFVSIRAEAREEAATAAPAPTTPGSDASQPAAAGGATAQSTPGTAAESTGNAVSAANSNATASAQQSGVDPSDTQTSEAARDGALPVGGGTATAPDGTTTVAPTALDTVPLTLDFTGKFSDLASFFHELKRYVKTTGPNVFVRGRLLTIEGVEFTSSPESFPQITATLTATAYLAPETEGATAGATPSGPAPTTPATADSQPAVAPPTATAVR